MISSLNATFRPCAFCAGVVRLLFGPGPLGISLLKFEGRLMVSRVDASGAAAASGADVSNSTRAHAQNEGALRTPRRVDLLSVQALCAQALCAQALCAQALCAQALCSQHSANV